MRFGPVCFLAFSLAACGSGWQSTPPTSDPSPTVLGVGEVPSNEILVYRRAEPGVTVNLAAAPAILLDGRSIGTCRIAQPILIRVPKGTWTITALAANGEVSQQVTVGESDRAAIRCGTSPVPPQTPVLIPVDPETARTESGL
jgi:hypothetical protein